MIYLDNAATTVSKPETVICAVTEAMRGMGSAARGAHGPALTAARTVFAAREAAAALFGCPRADHVAFCQNATEALNIALSGLLNPGDHVITTDLAHNSVLRPLYRLAAERDVTLSFVSADSRGCVDLDDFVRLCRPDTRLIVTTHASNVTGNVLDISAIGAFAHARGLLYVVDAAQTAGERPIDMRAANADVLCFTGHKGLMGPQGTGGLAVMPGVEIRPYTVGGTGVQTKLMIQPPEYPVRLEAGTRNGHGLAGLLAALNFVRSVTPQAIGARETMLARRFYDAVSALDGVTVYGDFSGDRAPIVALNIRDYPSSLVADELGQTYDIAVRAGTHCAPRTHRALGTEAQGAVRFSFGYFNTPAEADEAADAVRRIAAC